MVELENLIHKTLFQCIQSVGRVYPHKKKKNRQGEKDQREGECESAKRSKS